MINHIHQCHQCHQCHHFINVIISVVIVILPLLHLCQASHNCSALTLLSQPAPEILLFKILLFKILYLYLYLYLYFSDTYCVHHHHTMYLSGLSNFVQVLVPILKIYLRLIPEKLVELSNPIKMQTIYQI